VQQEAFARPMLRACPASQGIFRVFQGRPRASSVQPGHIRLDKEFLFVRVKGVDQDHIANSVLPELKIPHVQLALRANTLTYQAPPPAKPVLLERSTLQSGLLLALLVLQDNTVYPVFLSMRDTT
jgi:hypothetical protein